MKKLDLNALESVRPTVEKDGQSYAVRPVTARVVFIVDAARAVEGVERIRGFVDAVSALVPDMPRAAVEDLTMEQLLAIVEFASDQVVAVQEAAADPNAVSSAPATSSATEPTPAPATATT